MSGVNKSKEGAAKYIQKMIIDLGEYDDSNRKSKNSDQYDACGLSLAILKRTQRDR